MLTHRRNLIVEFFILFIMLLVISLPAQAGGSVHKAKVIEHWTPERMNAAQPRDFFLDKKGKAYMGSRQHGFSPYDQVVKGQETAADTSDPDISNRFPADDAIIGYSSSFSADVSDSEFESDTGVRTVSFVIQYPAGNTESFRASNTAGDSWGVNLNGFTDSTGWAWWIEAKDRAKKGGNRTTSAAFSFDVNTGTPPVDDDTTPVPPADGIIQNTEWEGGGAVQTAAGRIYFEMPGNSKRKGPWSGYVCSGTVVNDSDAVATETTSAVDNGRAIIVTAAHCAYDDVNKAFARNVLFIPNQAYTTGTRTDSDCDNDPLGCWTPSFAVVDTDWSSSTFPANIPWDYAYYVVDDSDGDDNGVSDAYSGQSLPSDVDYVYTLQAVAGGLPLSFDLPNADDTIPGPSSTDFTHALGYSYSDDPNFMYCAEDMTTEEYIKDAPAKNWWLSQCDLSGGSSGGPWLQPVTDGNGPIISVNSWGYTTGSGMAGPFLYENDSSASCLYGFAESTDFSDISTTDGDAGIKEACDQQK
ncbi:MAG: hypothetical protein V7765_13490 [Oleispira sp.]